MTEILPPILAKVSLRRKYDLSCYLELTGLIFNNQIG